MQLNSKDLLVQLKVLILYLFIFKIAFGYGIPLMEAIGAVPAIKNSNVETIMTGARTATVANADTAIFAEGAHHFTTSGLYDLETFLVFVNFCHSSHIYLEYSKSISNAHLGMAV